MVELNGPRKPTCRRCRRSRVAGAGSMRNVPVLVDESGPELHQQVQRALQTQCDALATESAFLEWLAQFVTFHGERTPQGPQHRRSAGVPAFLNRPSLSGHSLLNRMRQPR